MIKYNVLKALNDFTRIFLQLFSQYLLNMDTLMMLRKGKTVALFVIELRGKEPNYRCRENGKNL